MVQLGYPSAPATIFDKFITSAMTLTGFKVSIDWKLWLAAIKPPIYSVAIIPIVVGTVVASAQTQHLEGKIFLTFVGAAIAIIAWLNLSNDVFDSETGIDENKFNSVVNITGNKSLVFWLSNLCLALGFLGIGAIAFWQRDWHVLAFVALACALGYSYQGPPFRLGYQGLGEPICFICFGPVAVSAAYYSQVQAIATEAIAASIPVGIGTTLILFCSHFHQIEDDRAAGKRSPIVRLGTARAAKLLPWMVGSLYASTTLFALCGWFPPTTLLVWVTLPAARKLVLHVSQNHDRPERVSNCKFLAVRVYFWSGLLLGIGFLGAVL